MNEFSGDIHQGCSLLSDAQRYWLKLNPFLGAGNFLHVAHGVNAETEVPLVWTDEPFYLEGQLVEGPLSLSQLKAGADGIARWYAAMGVRAKDPVGVYGVNGLHYLLHYVALTSLGAIPVLTNGAMLSSTALAHMLRVGAIGVVADEAQHVALSEIAPVGEFRFLARMDQIVPPGAEVLMPQPYPFIHDDLDPVTALAPREYRSQCCCSTASGSMESATC
jgi:hypothetical protein